MLHYNYSLSSLIIFIHIFTRSFINKKEIITITQDLSDTILGISKIILFYTTISNNIYIETNLNNFDKLILNSIPNQEISNVLTYNNIDYIMSSLVLLYDKDYEYLYHHIITFSCVSLCQYYNYHNIVLICLTLFTMSSPLLSFAKLLRHNNFHKLSAYVFMLFGFVFFIYRIIFFTLVLKVSIFNEYYYTPQYYIINITELLIYKMQLKWMYKIVKTITNYYKK